jgi:hypothetical protein
LPNLVALVRVYFDTENPNSGIIWKAIEWKIGNGLFYEHLFYF